MLRPSARRPRSTEAFLTPFTSGATAMPMSRPVAQLIARMTDAFESIAESLPAPNVTSLHDRHADTPTPATLAECVPLLAVVLELINRGPDALTIEGVESYRGKIMQLLEHIRPAVEREAKHSL